MNAARRETQENIFLEHIKTGDNLQTSGVHTKVKFEIDFRQSVGRWRQENVDWIELVQAGTNSRLTLICWRISEPFIRKGIFFHQLQI
jgi:hypothetical protein